MNNRCKAIITTGSLLLMAVEAFSQSDLGTLRERYEADPRDVSAVTALADALEQSGNAKEAESIVRAFMAGCPVTQIEDPDTYLLISRYVFEDPYSNVFEYGLFLMPRMKWQMDGEAASRPPSSPTSAELKAEKDRKRLADLRHGVSHGNEIDKRYEVLSLICKGLNKGVNALCDPEWHDDGTYAMPDYIVANAEHLERLLGRTSLPGADAMRAKLKIAKAVNAGETSEAMHYLCTASALDITGINGSYLIGMMHILADMNPRDADCRNAIDTLGEQLLLSQARGSSHNYYTVLGRYYRLIGDDARASETLDKGRALEAQREALYNEMFNSTTR